jgi:putative transcriptional regulator
MDNDVRVMRAMRNITQEELAEALDVSRQTIISIENGKYDPSLKLAFKISNFFGKSIEELFKE